MLIASTGITGLAFADNPYETTEGKPLLGTPLIEARGRAAGSPDNAQSTHFFMWNDEGTYLLKAPPAGRRRPRRPHDVGRRPHRARRDVQGEGEGRPRRFSAQRFPPTRAGTGTCRTCRAARCSCRSPR